jgi:hypothetical protein
MFLLHLTSFYSRVPIFYKSFSHAPPTVSFIPSCSCLLHNLLLYLSYFILSYSRVLQISFCISHLLFFPDPVFYISHSESLIFYSFLFLYSSFFSFQFQSPSVSHIFYSFLILCSTVHNLLLFSFLSQSPSVSDIFFLFPALVF